MIILLTFCTVCGSLCPLAKNACLSCLLVATVLKEIQSTAASSATTLSSDSLVGLKQFSIVQMYLRNICLCFSKKLAVLLSLCQEQSYVLNQGDFSLLLKIHLYKKSCFHRFHILPSHHFLIVESSPRLDYHF